LFGYFVIEDFVIVLDHEDLRVTLVAVLVITVNSLTLVGGSVSNETLRF